LGAALKHCVVDAARAASWLLPDESSAEGERILAAYENGELQFNMPGLWNYEVINALLVAHRRKRLDDEGFAEARELFGRIQGEFHEQTDAVCRRRIFHFAQKHQLTAYDAAYLELADRLQVPLYSLGDKLLKAAALENLKTSFE